MCGGTSNYRTPSLIVGWLYVVLSIVAVIYYAFLLVTFVQKPVGNTDAVELMESLELGGNDFQLKFKNVMQYTLIAYIAGALLLCFVPSVLLVKGIKQNRRKLVAPWLYIAYVSVAINCISLIFMIGNLKIFTGNLNSRLIKCLPVSMGLIVSMLCIYPVRKLYNILSIPPPILPTHCSTVTKTPEDQLRYAPVFDN